MMEGAVLVFLILSKTISAFASILHIVTFSLLSPYSSTFMPQPPTLPQNFLLIVKELK